MEVVLRMLFLIFSNANIQFVKKNLIWRSYILAKALFITKQIELTNKKELNKATLDENIEAFVMHKTFFSLR